MASRPLIPLVVVTLAVAMTVWGILTLFAGDGGNASGTQETVTIGGETFTLDVSADDATRALGLMGVTSIDPAGGMLFVFPKSEVRSFWMKNCVIDMDIVFVDGQGRVTAIHTMVVEPPQLADESDLAYQRRLTPYSSRYPSQFAIELRAGTAERLGIGFDDRIDLDVERLRALAE